MGAGAWEALGPILGLVVGLGVVGSVVALALRHSRRSTEHIRAQVAAFNEVMRRAAKAGGLTYVDSPDYEHPVVGSIPCFGRLSGARDGLRFRVDVQSDHSPGDRAGGTTHTRVRITVHAPPDHPFDRRQARDIRRQLDADRLRLDALDEDTMEILGPRARGPSRYGQAHGLPDDSAELLALVDRAFEGARAALR